jgi:S1-C subfamily serine protease
MAWRRFCFLGLVLGLSAGFTWPLSAQQGGDINDQYEKAIKDAAKKVGPSIVQIQTQGGTDMIVAGPKGQTFRKALGPTTGVVVDPDGYIISSAFNFINNPTNIIVALPGEKEPVLAKKIATDKSRMLTLLKVDKTGLPVPKFVPVKELKVGQSALALGRTLDFKALDTKREHPPSISHGIISALGRIWGKAIQTDAKISPVNYGGPLVDITGRVQGIIVPASPRGDDVTAGFEWYDSGIGFAIPMEDVMAVVPKLKKGQDLEKATLGVQMQDQDQFGALPVVGNVTAGSAAAKAGLQAGDLITEVEGKPVVNQAQILHIIGPKYEGDVISLKYKRGGVEVAVAKMELVSTAKAVKYQHPFLGVLAMRDDPKLGALVRYVYPKSPADAAGIKPGDRIVKYGESKDKAVAFKGAKRGRDELADFLDTQAPGKEIYLWTQDKDGKAKGEVKIKLDAMPGSTVGTNDVVPDKLPEIASVKKAREPLETPEGAKEKDKKGDDKKIQTGLLNLLNAAGDRKYWVYIHKDYDPNVSHAVVVWLHMPGKFTPKDTDEVTDDWDDHCKENNIILVGPLTEQEAGWTPGDTEFVLETIRYVVNNYTVDKNRIVAFGMGNGGQMAFNAAFKARDTIRGAATLGSVLTEPMDNVANQRLAFYIAGGDRDPVIRAISETRNRLVNRHFPVLYREFPNRSREKLDEKSFAELVRWIDSLDRQ